MTVPGKLLLLTALIAAGLKRWPLPMGREGRERRHAPPAGEPAPPRRLNVGVDDIERVVARMARIPETQAAPAPVEA